MTRRFLLFLLLPSSVSAAQRKKRRQRQLPKIDTSSPFLAIPGTSQQIQNEQAELDGLERLVETDQNLEKFRKEWPLVEKFEILIQDRRLIPLSKITGLKTRDLDRKWHFCRRWTAEFLEDLAKMHRKNFHNKTLFVTSAVRTVERQGQIAKRNPNAAEIDESFPSVHLTGSAIDITKKGMTRQQILWMRHILLPLHGKTIYIVEEFSQPCFHIMVFKNYKKPDNWQ